MGQIIDIKKAAAQDEQIDRYLRNQMTGTEEQAFEASLRADASLRSRARFVAQTIKALRDTEESLQSTSESRMVARNPLATTQKRDKR